MPSSWTLNVGVIVLLRIYARVNITHVQIVRHMGSDVQISDFDL